MASDERGRPATPTSDFVRRNALLLALTAVVLAALTANVAPQVIELVLRALGLEALGHGVATLLARLTDGLIVLLLLALYVERRPFRQMDDRIRHLGVEVERRLTDMQGKLGHQLTQLHVDHLRDQMVHRKLREVLVEQFDNPLGNLLDLVLPQAVNPVLKAQFSIRLVSQERPDELLFDYEGQFSIRQNEYIIGIVTSKGHVDRLADANAPIHSIFVLPSTDRLDALTAEQVVQRYHVRLQYLDQRTSTWLDAHPEPIAHPHSIWSPTNPGDRFPLTLLRLGLPENSSVRLHLVRLSYRLPVSLDEGFWYWAATHPIYVERIEVDASRLRHVRNLRFVRFLPNFDRTNTSDLVTGVFTVVGPNWVLKGHGIILFWQRDPDSREPEPITRLRSATEPRISRPRTIG